MSEGTTMDDANDARERPSTGGRRRCAFSLIELLLVVAIITLLTSIVLPSLSMVREHARSAQCLAQFHGLGIAMGSYHTANRGRFWPCTIRDHPQPGVNTYFWGTNTDPVDPSASPFLNHCDDNLALLWCPSMAWGTYVPQGHVSEPTTTYAYNSWFLDPGSYLWNPDLRPKLVEDLESPASLFVFNDAGIVDTWAAGGIFKNSTHMEPVTGTYVQTPTTHFRHLGMAGALCADGHAALFGLEGGRIEAPAYNLGFVGASNVPHYADR